MTGVFLHVMLSKLQFGVRLKLWSTIKTRHCERSFN